MMFKQIVIYDANVIIDLHKIGLLPLLEQANVQLHTTSIVTMELKNPKWDDVKLILPSLVVHSYDTFEQYVTLQSYMDSLKDRGNISMADASVLYLAVELSAPLCTGDIKLRKVAKNQGVAVQGTIGIIQQLHKEGLINRYQAIHALRQLLATNSYMAPELIDQAINNLSSQP